MSIATAAKLLAILVLAGLTTLLVVWLFLGDNF